VYSAAPCGIGVTANLLSEEALFSDDLEIAMTDYIDKNDTAILPDYSPWP
jgi:hypothetical protein